MKKTFWRDFDNIFFIGIGGISMSGLAVYLKEKGFNVSGSDIAESERTAFLKRKGIRVFEGHRRENILGAQIVVCNSAIKEDNPELCAAREAGLIIVGRAELLDLVSRDCENVVAIAGCHGKTTTTAMCAHVLENCAESLTAHIGGEDAEYGNMYIGGNRFFVTEACEYNGNFLKLRPDLAVVLNTDADHMEYYKTEKNLLNAYLSFAENARACIVCADDRISSHCRADVTFGLSPQSDVSAEEIVGSGGRYSFRLRVSGEIFDRIRLNVYGKHNILNALAAAAVGVRYRFPIPMIKGGLENFKGIKRRFEKIGKYNGALFVADYAHHPGEIAAALRTACETAKGRLFVIFQPHTYSRTRLLFSEFVRVLEGVENLVIYRTYPAREFFDAAGSALTLSESLPNSLYVESVKELSLWLRRSVGGGDTVLVLGAGDIYCAAKLALKQLRSDL